MTIQDCHIQAKQKVEENLTNGGITLDPARFIYLFNACSNRYVLDILHRKNNEDIRKIQQLFVSNKLLTQASSDKRRQQFKLPDDYFGFSDIHGQFSKDGCTISDMEMWEAKNENVHVLYTDEFNKPSFEFRETFYTIGEGSVNVYIDDFSVSSIYLSYYRYPKQVDMVGNIHSDETEGSNIDPEFDDKVINEILNMLAKQFMLNDGDTGSYSVNKDNVMSDR